MPPRFVLLDWSLLGLVGHAYEYDKNVLHAFQMNGFETWVYGNRAGTVADVAGTEVRKWFSHAPSDKVVGWRVLRPFAKMWVHATRSAAELRQALRETDGPDTIYFIQHAESYHLPGLLRGFRGLHGRLVLMLRGTSLKVRDGVSRPTFRTKLYRLFMPPLVRALGSRLLLVTDSDNLRDEYARLINHHIVTVPLPNPLVPPPVARHRGDRLRLLASGRVSKEKGTHYLPALIHAVRQRQLPVLFQVHAYAGADASIAERHLLAELETFAGHDVELVRAPLSTDDYWAQTRAADISLLLYDVSRYRNQTSNLVLDALASGTFPIVSEGTWLSEIVALAGFGAAVDVTDPAMLPGRIADILAHPLPQAADGKVTQLLQYHTAESFYRVVLSALHASVGASQSQPPAVI